MNDPTRPSPATRDAERAEADAAHDADRPPTEAEEQAAPTEVGEDVSEHEREMAERGAHQRGEGRIA